MIQLSPQIFFRPTANSIDFASAVPGAESKAKADELIAKRKRVLNAFRDAMSRVLGYAKHETLRKIERHYRVAAAVSAANEDTQTDNPDSVKLNFDLTEFKKDLLAALAEEQQAALADAADQMWGDELDRSDPWKLPAKDTVDFIRRRENLLSDVPDEIWQQIKEQLVEGLDKGESIRDLSKRITDTFDAIEQGRAEVIATTETDAAYSFARNEASKAAGIKYKMWLHTALPSLQPRLDHLAIHGTVVPFDEPFPVGDPELMYPHDPEGSPEDTINCRCIVVALSDDEGAKLMEEQAAE